MSENPSYEITFEKVTRSENESKSEVLAFYQGRSFHIQQSIGPVTVDMGEGDVLIVLRLRDRLQKEGS